MNAYFFLELHNRPSDRAFTPDYTGSYCPSERRKQLLDRLPVMQSFERDKVERTIAYYGTYFEGFIPFHNVAPGIANIYARARDTVFNLSNSVQKAVLVFRREVILAWKSSPARSASGFVIEVSEITPGDHRGHRPKALLSAVK